MSSESSNLLIRRAQPSDVDAIVALWEELLDFHQERDPYYTRVPDAAKHSAEHLAKKMSEEETILLVAEFDGAVVGYLMARSHPRPPVFVGGPVISISDICVKNGYPPRAGPGSRWSIGKPSLVWLTRSGTITRYRSRRIAETTRSLCTPSGQNGFQGPIHHGAWTR